MKEQKEIVNSNKILQQGKVILYPTDTVWGIGCDATNEMAVSSIYSIKKRKESKSLVILVSSIDMLKHFVDEVPSKVLDVLKKAIKPTTIIYKNPKGLANNVIANDNTVAIRIAQDDFCKNLIENFGNPIVSTSANLSGNETPRSFKEIDPCIWMR